MGALSSLTGMFTAPQCKVRIDPRRCLRNRLSGNLCNLCLQSCPAGALSYRDGMLQHSMEQCSNCMRCTALCPNDALTARLDLQEFLALLGRSGEETCTFSCERSRRFCEGEIVVPCLAMFSYELLVYISTHCPSGKILFNISSCSGCVNEKPCREFQEDLQYIKQKGGTFRIPQLLLLKEGQPESSGDRRSFLKSLRQGAFQVAVSSLTTECVRQKESSTSRSIPQKTQIHHLARRKDLSRHPLALSMVPRLHTNGDCIPCPRCSGICPTGALKLVREDRSRKLMFLGERCSGCGLCAQFCKRSALSVYCDWSR